MGTRTSTRPNAPARLITVPRQFGGASALCVRQPPARRASKTAARKRGEGAARDLRTTRTRSVAGRALGPLPIGQSRRGRDRPQKSDHRGVLFLQASMRRGRAYGTKGPRVKTNQVDGSCHYRGCEPLWTAKDVASLLRSK